MEPGDLISGKYRLERLLGAGGMGSVWAARNEMTERDFAIKFLLPALSQNKDALHRFFLEARACGRIKHPAVVAVYDVGQADDGSPFLVMELLDGEGLEMRVDRGGPIPAAEAVRWMAFVARGLEEAHLRGVLHRDLKPQNVFLSVDAGGEIIPKILDFGVSKVTGPRSDSFQQTLPGAVLGSPAYMSPEQARGDTQVDERSDVWALGIILYEMLTGQVPFVAGNYNALLVAIWNSPYRPVRELVPDVPESVAAIIDGALVKDRNKRTGSARELAEQLEAVLATIAPHMARLPSAIPRAAPSSPPGPAPPAATGSSPAASGRPTTQSTWSDRRRTLMRSTPRRVWPIAVLAAAVLAAGALVALTRRPPPVAMASRAAAYVAAVVARVSLHMAQVHAQIAAEERARAELAAQRQEAAAAAASAAPSEPIRPAPRAPRATPRDPHGGVDGPGF